MKYRRHSTMSVHVNAFVFAVAACLFFTVASAQELASYDSPAPATTPADPVGTLRAIAAKLRADGQAESAAAIERQLEDFPRQGTFEVLSDQIAELRAQVSALVPLLAGRDPIAFGNQTAAEEGKQVLDGAVAGDASLLANVAKVELVKVFDASAAPMRRHAGSPAPVPGAFSEKALVGTLDSMMLWGPYEPFDAGRYLVVYRFQFLQAVRGDRVCFLDVCHKAVTYSGRRPGAKAAPPRIWNEIAVPIDVPKPMRFEFRMWPEGNRVVLDRIYVYRLTERKYPGSPGTVSVMGAVVRPGFYLLPNDKKPSADNLVKLAGGPNALAHPYQFMIWRRDGDRIETVSIKGDNARKHTAITSGDIIWIPERDSPNLLKDE